MLTFILCTGGSSSGCACAIPRHGAAQHRARVKPQSMASLAETTPISTVLLEDAVLRQQADIEMRFEAVAEGQISSASPAGRSRCNFAGTVIGRMQPRTGSTLVESPSAMFSNPPTATAFMAPTSSAMVVMLRIWLRMREISANSTRIYCARGGAVMPSSFPPPAHRHVPATSARRNPAGRNTAPPAGKSVLGSAFSVPRCNRPICGSARSITSPSISSTRRKTPCAAGGCGPVERVVFDATFGHQDSAPGRAVGAFIGLSPGSSAWRAAPRPLPRG